MRVVLVNSVTVETFHSKIDIGREIGRKIEFQPKKLPRERRSQAMEHPLGKQLKSDKLRELWVQVIVGGQKQWVLSWPLKFDPKVRNVEKCPWKFRKS
jgi:hypothetical protein